MENTFTAPAGFGYRWYNADNPSTTLSIGRHLHVTSPGNYCCWVYYLHTSPNCGFTLSTRAGPRYPVAMFTIESVNSCASEVKFVNQSVVAADSAHETITNEPCESYLWEFDDGTTSTLVSPTHTFYGEGTHGARLTAMLANGTCRDEYTSYYTLQYPQDTVYDTICPGVPYEFYGQVFYDSGLYSVQEVCGPHWLHLSYYEKNTSSRYDTICVGDTLWINNHALVDSGTHEIVVLDSLGCVASLYVHLTVHPTYFVRIKDTLPVGENITVGDTQFFAPALGGTTLHTVHGCDSTVWLRLSCIFTEDSTVCVDDLPLVWGDVTFTEEAVDTSYYLNHLWTDSIHVRNLHVRQRANSLLSVVPYCDSARFYIVTLSTMDCNYQWSSNPPIRPIMQENLDSLDLLYFRPTEKTQLFFLSDYVDAPLCPGADSVTIIPPEDYYLELEVVPETLFSDNLHLVAYDRGGHLRYRQWIVDSVVQQETGPRLEYEALPWVDSVVLVLIGGDSVCFDTVGKVVPVFKDYLFFPNVFTPGEAENNRFRGLGTEMKNFNLWIYDRRGVLMFHTADMAEGWDGTCNGMACPQGAYAYVCHYTLPNNLIRTKAGTVTLLR